MSSRKCGLRVINTASHIHTNIYMFYKIPKAWKAAIVNMDYDLYLKIKIIISESVFRKICFFHKSVAYKLNKIIINCYAKYAIKISFATRWSISLSSYKMRLGLFPVSKFMGQIREQARIKTVNPETYIQITVCGLNWFNLGIYLYTYAAWMQ